MAVTPAKVALLAMLFLRERLPRLQLAGIGLSGGFVLARVTAPSGGSWALLGNALTALRPVLQRVRAVVRGTGKVARDGVLGGVTTAAGFAVGLMLLLPFAAGEIYARDAGVRDSQVAPPALPWRQYH